MLDELEYKIPSAYLIEVCVPHLFSFMLGKGKAASRGSVEGDEPTQGSIWRAGPLRMGSGGSIQPCGHTHMSVCILKTFPRRGSLAFLSFSKSSSDLGKPQYSLRLERPALKRLGYFLFPNCRMLKLIYCKFSSNLPKFNVEGTPIPLIFLFFLLPLLFFPCPSFFFLVCVLNLIYRDFILLWKILGRHVQFWRDPGQAVCMAIDGVD